MCVSWFLSDMLRCSRNCRVVAFACYLSNGLHSWVSDEHTGRIKQFTPLQWTQLFVFHASPRQAQKKQPEVAAEKPTNTAEFQVVEADDLAKAAAPAVREAL